MFALVAFYEKYAGRLNRFLSGEEVSLPAKIGRGLFAYFAGTVIADLVASVATLPFGIYHFNQLDYYSSLTNLLSGPLIGFVIMPFVLVFLLAMPFGLEWLPLKIVGFGLSLTNRLTVWVASLPRRRFDAGLGVGADQSRRPLALPVARKLADMGNGGRCCRHACYGGGGQAGHYC